MTGRDDLPPATGETDGEGADRAFFGRRKGKRLRAGQERRLADLLPALRIALPPAGTAFDLPALFPHAVDEVRLEIGFGGGEHLAAQALRNRQVGFIGAEPFVNGVVKLLRAIDDDALRNVRIWDEDVTKLLARMPDAALARVDLLYPDPWPKRRQRKRRFVSDETLAEIARVLEPGGRFRFASDIDDYAGWTLVRAARCQTLRWTAQCACDWQEPWSDWPGTRYEAKAVAAGRAPTYLEFLRVGPT
jgi:tRNA (guanine-N7-)-methyltransferase